LLVKQNRRKRETADSSSGNAVSFSSARTAKRFPRGGRYSLNLFSQNVDTNCPFQFQKRSELVVGVHNEASSVAAMRVSNPDCSAFAIQC
jgi:hypothetical protein